MESLLNRKTCEVDPGAQGQYTNTDLSTDPDIFAHVDFTYHISGPDSPQRTTKWIINVVKPQNIVNYEQKPKSLRNTINIQIMFVSSETCSQAVNFIRKNERLLAEFAIIACVEKSNPSDRARLLFCGYDDVFDIGKMCQSEARARIGSIASRYAKVRIAHELKKLEEERLNGIALTNILTNKELAIIRKLDNCAPFPVPYRTIIGLIEDTGQSISQKYLNVIISNLRKKIKKPFHIEAVRCEGYRLVNNF